MHSEHLPIYKVAYDLHLRIYQITNNYQKEYKHSIAYKLIEHSYNILSFIYKANDDRINRKQMISEIIENIRAVQILSRISFDLKLINDKKCSEIIELTGNLNKQAAGWLNSC